MRTNDFDASIDDAWQEFRTELAAFLRELTAADLTWIEQDPSIPEGPHGRIDIRYTRAHRVRLTLDPLTLHTSVDCYRIQIGQLRALGWRRLAGGTYILEGGHARADEMAAAIVNTFRQVWETVHPTFLRAPFLADEPPRVEPTLRAGVVPHGPEHLRALVVSMLEEVTGQRIEVDDDGDVVLPTEPPSWLRVHEDLPRLVAFAMLTDSVSDPLVAAPYIAAQPTSRDGVRVMLRQRQVFAHRVIDVTVFSGDNLRAWPTGSASSTTTCRASSRVCVQAPIPLVWKRIRRRKPRIRIRCRTPCWRCCNSTPTTQCSVPARSPRSAGTTVRRCCS